MRGGKDWYQWQKWARKAVGPTKGLGPLEDRPNIPGTVAEMLGINPTPPAKPDLHTPEVFLDYFSRNSDCDISPH